ncbi:MAG: hypothetical protein H0T52_04655 [Lautropia sp.]|nr:hypothetical protein [Lautropia sp.]
MAGSTERKGKREKDSCRLHHRRFTVCRCHHGGCRAAGGRRRRCYLDLTATYPLREGLNLIAHVGHQKFKNYGDIDYTDYRLGATYDCGQASPGARR